MATINPRHAVLAAALGSLMLIAGVPAVAAQHAAGSRPHALTIRHRHAGPALAAIPDDAPPVAEPIVLPVGPGLSIQTPFFEVSSSFGPSAIVRIPHYRGPDGSYDDLGDLSSDIQGTPCGRDCTSRSLVRWGYEPVY